MSSTGFYTDPDPLIRAACITCHAVQHLSSVSDVPAVYLIILTGTCVEKVTIWGKGHLQYSAPEALTAPHYAYAVPVGMLSAVYNPLSQSCRIFRTLVNPQCFCGLVCCASLETP